MFLCGDFVLLRNVTDRGELRMVDQKRTSARIDDTKHVTMIDHPRSVSLTPQNQYVSLCTVIRRVCQSQREPTFSAYTEYIAVQFWITPRCAHSEASFDPFSGSIASFSLQAGPRMRNGKGVHGRMIVCDSPCGSFLRGLAPTQGDMVVRY